MKIGDKFTLNCDMDALDMTGRAVVMPKGTLVTALEQSRLYDDWMLFGDYVGNKTWAGDLDVDPWQGQMALEPIVGDLTPAGKGPVPA